MARNDQTPSATKSEIVAFMNRAALLMRVQLTVQRASALADFLIEQQYPANLFSGKTLNSIVAQFSEHFPSAQHLNDALKANLQNLDRERQQRGLASADQDTLARLIWARKILTHPNRHSADANRVAQEFADKFPQAYAQTEYVEPKPINRARTSNIMPMSEVIDVVAKYLDPIDASAYRALMSIPKEQRTEEERDAIFGLARIMTKRAGLTVPQPRFAPARERSDPPEEGPSPPVPPEAADSAGLADLGLQPARELIEPEPPPRRPNAFRDDI